MNNNMTGDVDKINLIVDVSCVKWMMR
jgi:hypothetical protein